jgi:hypothetical protein
MARTPDPKRHALWRDRVRRQGASDLTVAQFCAQECIARSKFYAWKHRIRVRDASNRRSKLPGPAGFSSRHGASLRARSRGAVDDRG